MMLRKTIILFATTLLASNLASAQAGGGTGTIQVLSQLETRYDTNAFRATDGAEEEGELQSALDLTVIGQKQGDFYSADVNYRAVFEYFEDDSQGDDTNFFGDSMFQLGRDSDRAKLEINHTITQVLREANSVLVNDNAFQQEVIDVIPSIQTRPDLANSLEIRGIYGQAKFEDDVRSDSEQLGGEIMYNRRASEFTNFGLKYRQLAYEFDEFGVLDYDLERTSVFINQTSRRLAYYIEAGRESVDSDSGANDRDGNFFEVNAEYSGESNTLGLAYSQRFSDTSFAGIASDEFSGFAVGGDNNVQDQIKVSTTTASLTNDSLCSICTLTFTYTHEDLEFATETDQDVVTENFIVAARFTTSAKSSLELTYNYRTTEFESAVGRDTDNTNAQIVYGRSITEELAFSSFYRRQERDGDVIPFDGDIFGFRIQYVLY